MSGQGFLYGGCKGYRKSAWLRVGGHPKRTLVEDAELAATFIDNGYKMAIIKSAPIVQEEVETFKQYMSEQKRWVSGDLAVNRIYGPSLRKNLLNYLLMLSNFSMDAVLFLSFVFLPYQLLLIIPILMSLIALYICMWGFKAHAIFFLFAPIYLWVGPLLRTVVILSLLKDKISGKKVTWTKVWHYPTPLKWPTYS
jgi:cellulose synthase/poly-beta-1,6-N-acetylglucosamine synthase-like glycosyltransferase